MAGIAVDWSKCYEHIPLSVLNEIADRAGLPAAVTRPMPAAYAFLRQICADGLAGEPLVPARGLAPGCPVATDWIALLMFVSAAPCRGAVAGCLRA